MDKIEKEFKLKYCKFYKDNSYEIFKNLNEVFGIDYAEFEHIINNTIEGLEKKIYEEALKDVDLRQCYSIDSLHKLLESFKSVNIDEKQIKQIILQYPEIITFSKMTDNIQYLYKANDLKAIVLIFNEKYDYHLIENNLLKKDYYYDYKLKSDNIMSEVENLKVYSDNLEKIRYNNIKLCKTLPNDFFGYLLKSLEREDIQKYYNLSNTSKLADRVAALEEEFNKREIYIKKKKK